jgi:hypothetical protein
MDSIFPDLIVLFNQVAVADITEKRKDMDTVFRAAWKAYRNDRASRAKFETLRTTVTAYHGLLARKSASVFDDLQKAHAELTKALHDPKLDFERLWPLLQRVTDEAVRLAEIAKEFREAVKQKTG